MDTLWIVLVVVAWLLFVVILVVDNGNTNAELQQQCISQRGDWHIKGDSGYCTFKENR